MSRADSKRVNIELDENLHRKAKAISVLEGIALSEFVQDAIKACVEQDIGLIAESAKLGRSKVRNSKG